ncbi:transposable element Tcb2 transposase [Trichonephila clavipes]|nr:transposable element Tcb2 transposase [Trichonephila clavipes]
MSFTRRPDSGRPRQTSRREDYHIVRNARVKPTASSAAIQAHSDAILFRVWRPRSERLNPAFALQRHIAPTDGAMVWGDNAYNTRLPLVMICVTMTAQWYVHDILQPHALALMQRFP